jgi:hypothetical protein
MSTAQQIAVVHLARAANGFEPFARFLDSYQKHPAGIEHELVVVFKGFSTAAQLAPFRERLVGIAHREIQITESGLDLDAYGLCVRQFVHEYFCFLNTFSVVQSDGWLAKLRAALAGGVGLVGATGSFESMYSDLTARQQKEVAKHLHTRARRAWKRFRKGLVFERFPNPHLRTNAFMISGELMRQLWPRKIGRKRAAHALESGKQSITRRVQKLGLKVLIVGRDGVGYEPERWPVSGIFWQAEQENLLVSDNQTLRYIKASAPDRVSLRWMAWHAETP